jgi:hypothetical protein
MSTFTKILGFPFRLLWSPICLIYYIPFVFFAKVGDSTRKNGWLMLLGIILLLWPFILILAIFKSIWMAITFAFSNTSKDDYLKMLPEKTYTSSSYENSTYSASDIRNNCRKCYGSGFVECYRCDGRGFVNSQHGFGPRNQRCNRCGGQGKKVCKH